MASTLLTFNAGSSTLKIGIFELGEAARQIGKGRIDFGNHPPTLRYSLGQDSFEEHLSGDNADQFALTAEETLAHLLSHISKNSTVLAAHRIVHGGKDFDDAVVLDDDALQRIEALVPLAPLHQPQSLRVVRALAMLRPGIVQTASFDTAFHASQSDLVSRLAIPRALHDDGIRRYGFHGLSYKFIASQLKRDMPDASSKTIAAHLGSGASLCAMEDGRSRDCSMGFSTLDGIPMATRPGSLDAGVLLYLMRAGVSTPEGLEEFLYHQCGMLGVSGKTGAMHELLHDDTPAAAEAIDLFCFRIAGEIGRMSVTLRGLDTLVFTAGIGENEPEIRRRVASHLAWMGVTLDEVANETNAPLISAPQSSVRVVVIPTDEERVIADEALPLIRMFTNGEQHG